MNARIFSCRHPARLAALAMGLLATAAWARAQTYAATAEFSPAQVAAGQLGNYLVAVTVTSPSGNTVNPQCTPPQVPGLLMNYLGMSTSMQSSFSFNGPATRIVTFNLQYQARAEKPGNYTVPAFDLTVNGVKVNVPAATLAVTERSANSAQSDGDFIGLDVKLPRKTVFVGEKVPLDLSLYWRNDLQPSLAGDLQLDNDAFERVLMQGHADFVPLTRNNQNYSSNVWHTILTPLKAGPQKLVLSLPLQVVIPDRSGFGDPLISQLMGQNAPFAMGEQRMVTVQNDPIDLDVEPLPADGRPENFTGGIGTFTVDEPSLSTKDLQVGVPVTLTVKVSGKGNFDRFNPPVLDLGPQWRTYPPKGTFSPQDATGYNGVKTFEYVVMPMAENLTSLPAPEVNFFNPESKTYVELPLRAIDVKVSPAQPGQAPVPLPALASTQINPNSDLVGLHGDTGGWQNPGSQVLLASPLFWAGQAMPALALAGLVIMRRRQLRLETDPAYARRLRARKLAVAAVAQARAAAAKGLATQFYAAAQRALQEAASHDRLDAAEALTWREFDAHLEAREAPRTVREQAREIFDAGDALRFGGYTPDQAALAAAAARLDSLVQQLLGRA